MSRQKRHQHREPAVLTVDTGSTGPLTRRFLTLMVRTHESRATEDDRELPKAS